jgi:hypothetical protein
MSAPLAEEVILQVREVREVARVARVFLAVLAAVVAVRAGFRNMVATEVREVILPAWLAAMVRFRAAAAVLQQVMAAVAVVEMAEWWLNHGKLCSS